MYTIEYRIVVKRTLQFAYTDWSRYNWNSFATEADAITALPTRIRPPAMPHDLYVFRIVEHHRYSAQRDIYVHRIVGTVSH